MNYQTYQPNSDLSPFVKCYWTLESPVEKTPARQRIVPDGCMEMIFHYGDQYRQYISDKKSIIQPNCFVFGQLTQPLEIEPTGKTGIFSVRFHPEGFTPFSSLPIKELDNKAVALEKIFGEKGKVIQEEILNADSTENRIQYIEAFLIQHLTNTENIDSIIKSTVLTILTGKGQIPIDQLSEKMNINRRQLERKFASSVGLSPKQLSKIIRLQSTLKKLLNKEFTTLSSLAYEGEYYDQAHFIKDFKEFTGQTPKEFYGDNLKMSSLFYSNN